LYFISLLFYIIKSKGTFRVYMLGLLILFVNPFSSLFVSRFIASVVYYRSFELLFNPFTTILFIILMFDWIRNKTMNRILVGSLFLWLIPLVITHSQMYYHPSFIPTQAYSSLYRLDSNQMDTLSLLKTKIELENYDQAIVVSQIEGVRGFVPNVITPISNEDIRNIDKYTLNPETSKLLTIFENRDYIGQQIFDTEPDYIHTCQYLMDAQVDFVVVDKRQFFVDETGQFIPLYFLVRDCATPVFENTDYFIYQFYW